MRKSSKRLGYLQIALIILSICIQMYIVVPATEKINVAGDMVFTYTLANNTYSPLFFNMETIDTIPNSDGWFDAGILREWYQVNDYNRFDYKGVYWHQRIDVHPPLYYVLVHTVCSLFPNTYSNMYAGLINILGILAIDIVFVLLFKALYNNSAYAILPILLIPLHNGFASQIFNLRMYILLAAVCFWYLYIHISGEINGWTRKRIFALVLCIIIGCQTHNYFYVYAFGVSLIQICCFISRKRYYSLINYVFAGCIGIMSTLIIFPWMVWQIFFNQQDKHTEIIPWNMDKIKTAISFIDEYWLNKRGILILFVFAVCWFFVYLYKKEKKEDSSPRLYIWIITVGSTFIYAVVIFTLDGMRDHYNTPEYIPILFLFSAFIVWVITAFTKEWGVVLPIALIVGISLMGNYPKVYYDYFSTIYTANCEWSGIAQKYHECDCLCVGMEELHLMDYSFYEVAQYDEVKVIDKSGYDPSELNRILTGRNTNSDPVIIYISEDLSIPEDTVLLMNWRGFNCVYWENGNE